MANMRSAVQPHAMAGSRGDVPGMRETTGLAHADPVFHESLRQRLRRWLLGAAYALRPNRIALLPRLAWMTLTHWLRPEGACDRLPEHPVYYSSRGLVGISNDLSLE